MLPNNISTQHRSGPFSIVFYMQHISIAKRENPNPICLLWLSRSLLHIYTATLNLANLVCSKPKIWFGFIASIVYSAFDRFSGRSSFTRKLNSKIFLWAKILRQSYLRGIGSQWWELGTTTFCAVTAPAQSSLASNEVATIIEIETLCWIIINRPQHNLT